MFLMKKWQTKKQSSQQSQQRLETSTRLKSSDLTEKTLGQQ